MIRREFIKTIVVGATAVSFPVSSFANGSETPNLPLNWNILKATANGRIYNAEELFNKFVGKPLFIIENCQVHGSNGVPLDKVCASVDKVHYTTGGKVTFDFHFLETPKGKTFGRLWVSGLMRDWELTTCGVGRVEEGDGTVWDYNLECLAFTKKEEL